MGSREAKVADFDSALGVNKKVSWLDVSVDHVGGVHEVHGAEHAVDDGDHVVLRELELRHRLENFFHVSLHEFHDDEDGAHAMLALWGDDVEDLGGEVVVLHLSELSQDLDLANDLL